MTYLKYQNIRVQTVKKKKKKKNTAFWFSEQNIEKKRFASVLRAVAFIPTSLCHIGDWKINHSNIGFL